MNLNYLIKIYGVGTGDNSTIGMVDGCLQWSTTTRTGYKSGLLDVGSISSIGSACNILEGGELGGFVGGVSIKVHGQSIVSAVDGGTISLNGRSFVISAVVGSDINAIYTGTITKSFCPDSITLEITSQPAYSLDNHSIAFVTVTPEMALGSAKSSAVGKAITPIYGNVVSYPLVYCEPSSETLPVMTSDAVTADDGNGNVLYAPAYPHVGNGYQELTPNKDFYKGLSLMQVVSAWQQTALTTPVWITLSVNGKHILFDNAAQANINQIRAAFMSKTLVGVSGTGKGEFYKITDVEWNTHNSLTTVWLQLDISDVSKIKASAPWVSTSDNGNADFRISQGGSVRGYTSKIRGAYESGAIDSDKTILSFSAPTNIFLVCGDCDVSANNTIYSVENEIIEQLDNIKIDVIYKTELWQMVALQSTKMDANNKTFVDENYFQIPSTIYEDSGVFNGTNVDGGTPKTDGFTDKTYLTTPLTTRNIYPAIGFPNTLNAFSTVYVPIDDLVSGLDLSKDYTTSLIPKFKWIFDGSWYGVGKLKLKISVNVVGEGNLILGNVTSENTINYDKSVAGSVGLEIIPEDGIVSFTDSVTSYGLTSATLYNTIKSQLDISELLAVDSIYKIRALVVTISGEYTGLSGWVNPSNFVCDKVISAPVLCITKRVPLSNLFIRSIYDTSITSPANLIKSIATDNGIVCDDASFTYVDGKQRAMMGGDYNGYYAPSAGESVSSVLSSIAKMSGVGLWIDAAGVLCVTDVQTPPEVAQYGFNGSVIVDGSLSLSTSDTSYMASDFSFEVATDGIRTPRRVAINANTEDFPLETEFHLSDVIYSSSTGWELIHGTILTSHIALNVRGASSYRSLLHSFVGGTVWQIEMAGIGRAIARLDAVAIDPACPVNQCGLRLGFITLSWDNSVNVTASNIRLRSPQPRWREYVSGECITEYATAQAMYSYAKAARTYLGKSIAANQSATKLTQPIWGDDNFALSRWMLATVKYSTANKLIAKFSTPLDNNLIKLQILSYVTFSWGKFHASNVSAWVVGKVIDAANGLIEWSLAIIGISGESLSYLLTETGLPVLNESGEGITLETETTETGTKISDMPISTVQGLIDSHAVIPVAISGVSNASVKVSDIETYAIDVAKSYTDSKLTFTKRVFYVGSIGDTSVTVPHGMGTNELTIQAFSGAETIALEMSIDDINISIDDLAPITTNNQIKLVVMR